MIHKHDWTNNSKLVFSGMEIHSVENSDVNKKQNSKKRKMQEKKIFDSHNKIMFAQ